MSPERPARILHVEDQEDQRYLVRAAVQTSGAHMQIDQAGALQEGIEMLRAARRHQPYDSVLLDLCLPDSTGVETMQRMRDETDRPIVVLTALDSRDVALNCLDLGAAGVLVKGTYDITTLADMLIQAISRQLATVEARRQAHEAEALSAEAGRIAHEEEARHLASMRAQHEDAMAELREIEAALLGSEERLRAVLPGVPHGG